MSNRRRSQTRQVDRFQRGFTLLELMVVLVILGSLIGLVSTAYRQYEQQAAQDLARVEMIRVARAINRYQRDVGYFPKLGNAEDNGESADLSWLFVRPATVPRWNISRRRGWNGPYIEPASISALAVSATVCELIQSPDKVPDQDLFAIGFTSQHVNGLSDTFRHHINAQADNRYCFADYVGDRWLRRGISGQPYQYRVDFYLSGHPQCPDNSHACIVLQSFGLDGKDDGGAGDDLVQVVRGHDEGA